MLCMYEAPVRSPASPELSNNINSSRTLKHSLSPLIFNQWGLIKIVSQRYSTKVAKWSRGMIPALGAGGPGFKSPFGPHIFLFFLHHYYHLHYFVFYIQLGIQQKTVGQTLDEYYVYIALNIEKLFSHPNTTNFQQWLCVRIHFYICQKSTSAK